MQHLSQFFFRTLTLIEFMFEQTLDGMHDPPVNHFLILHNKERQHLHFASAPVDRSLKKRVYMNSNKIEGLYLQRKMHFLLPNCFDNKHTSCTYVL